MTTINLEVASRLAPQRRGRMRTNAGAEGVLVDVEEENLVLVITDRQIIPQSEPLRYTLDLIVRVRPSAAVLVSDQAPVTKILAIHDRPLF